MPNNLIPVPLEDLDPTGVLLDNDQLYLSRDPDDLLPGEAADKRVPGSALRAGVGLSRRAVTLANGAANATIVIWAQDAMDKLGDLPVDHDGGAAIVIGAEDGVTLHSVFVTYDPGFNPGTTWSFRYPAPFGETALEEIVPPELRHWSVTDPMVMQPLTLQNCSIDGGIIQIQRTGLLAGTAARWKLQVV